MEPDNLRALVRGHDALETAIRREHNSARRKLLLKNQIDLLQKVRDGIAKLLKPVA